MNETRVLQLDAAAAVALQQSLQQSLPPDAEWRRVDHARFAVKAEGASLVCYLSGKLVVQGKDLDPFVQRYLSGAAAVQKRAADPVLVFDGPTIGSDEAGKGDFFGPLVVAAVFAEPAREDELRQMGIADSKTLSDLRMMPMAERIEQGFDVEVRMLMPPQYNARYRQDPNVNHLLADLHAEAITALLQRHPGAIAVVDRFATESVLASRLEARPSRLVQVPRAEAHPVVGAASVVARVHFLEGIKQCEEACAVELHKGAGPPTDAAAQRVFSVGGAALLAQVAKLHFKNAERIRGYRP